MCVGGWTDPSWTNIKNLIAANNSNVLYQNLLALKNALGIDAIDNDDESAYDPGSTIKFGQMCGSAGLKLTLCPYTNPGYWQAVKAGLGGTCDQVYLQGYDGGAGNNPATWNTYFGGARYTHGTPFRRAAEEGLLDLSRSLHVGTRGPQFSAKDLHEDAALGFRLIDGRAIDDRGTASIASEIREVVGDAQVYLSLDIDVLDPAFAPGTGTPEAGGWSSREAIAIIRRLGGIRLAGADVVEVAPAYDHAEVTAIAAANIVYELLCLFAISDAAG